MLTQIQQSQEALSILKERIGVVRSYLEEVDKGGIPPDHELLREVSSVVSRIPIQDSGMIAQQLTEVITSCGRFPASGCHSSSDEARRGPHWAPGKFDERRGFGISGKNRAEIGRNCVCAESLTPLPF